jgi:hypothetical protein
MSFSKNGGAEIFIVHSRFSTNENPFKLNKIIIFLGLILIESIIFSGAVSATNQGISHNITIQTNNSTSSSTGSLNSKTLNSRAL